MASYNLRVLTKLRSDLENSWALYSDAHHEYAIKENNEDDLNAAIQEHEQLDDDQDNLIVRLDEAKKKSTLLVENALSATPMAAVQCAYQPCGCAVYILYTLCPVSVHFVHTVYTTICIQSLDQIYS